MASPSDYSSLHRVLSLDANSAFVFWDEPTNSEGYILVSDLQSQLGGTTPTGSGTEIQYKNGSSFGAITGSSWNGTTLTLPQIAVSSGSINGVAIGATTPSTGAFTTLTATSNVTGNEVFGINSFKLGSTGSNGYLTSTEWKLRVDATLAWSSTTNAFVTADTILLRDAANTLAMRNGTNAQTLRLYNTYTDAANYERGGVYWSGNGFYVTNEAAGTGIARAMYVGTVGSNALSFIVNNSTRWTVNTAGNLVAGADNAYDIGASGANRPRTVYVGTGVTTPKINFSASFTPTGTADASGGGGELRYDDNFLYVKTSAGWKRSALSTF